MSAGDCSERSERWEDLSGNMGFPVRIATPASHKCDGLLREPSSRLSKQGIGGGAMGGGLVPVGFDARDLVFQQRNPLRQLALRIGAEVFACEATRRVSTGAWAIGFIHCDAASAPSGLLSIGETVIRRGRLVKAR